MRPGLVLIAAFALLGFGVTQATAYPENPPPAVGPALVVTYPTPLVGLFDALPTFASTDVAIGGIPDTDVGIDAASADALADPSSAALIVDDDKAQCPQATYTTIDEAMLFAMPGDTIKVCPGDYKETVVVDKSVQLRGSTQTSNGRCATPVIPDPTKDSIVHYPVSGLSDNGGSPGFDVQADNVLIAGFLVEPLAPGAGGPIQDGDGIYSGPTFSGAVIRDNIVQHNARGMRLHSNGMTQSVVKKNCVRDNNLGSTLTLTGQGIYLSSPVSNILVEHNFTTLNGSAAINLSFATDITIAHNKSVADDSAVAIFDSSTIDFLYNKASDATGSTVFLGADNRDVHIVSNHVENGAASGIRLSNLNFGGPPDPNTMVEVRDNQVDHMGSSGIRAGGPLAGPALISSTVARNHSHDNAVDGIRIEADNNPPATPNTITENKLKHNGEHDCRDDTVGPFTGGTANVWTNNEGDTQTRPDLCKHATTTP
jgi:nitrous oxidase accessory protein NosD